MSLEVACLWLHMRQQLMVSCSMDKDAKYGLISFLWCRLCLAPFGEESK